MRPQVAVTETITYQAVCRENKCGWSGNKTTKQSLAEQEADIHEKDHNREERR